MTAVPLITVPLHTVPLNTVPSNTSNTWLQSVRYCEATSFTSQNSEQGKSWTLEIRRIKNKTLKSKKLYLEIRKKRKLEIRKKRKLEIRKKRKLEIRKKEN